MANSSMTESQATKGHKFLDHSDCYTYKVNAARDEVEGADWVLNCVVKIKCIVESEDGDSEGGVLAAIQFASQGTFDTYIPNSAWNTVEQFKAAIRRYSKRLPAVFSTFSQSDLQKYGEDRIRTFYNSASTGPNRTKKKVTRLGRQSDGKTIVLGPKLAFVDNGDVVESVNLIETDYAWIPYLLPELSIDSECEDQQSLFEESARLFTGSSLYAYALTLGGFYMGIHYDKIMEAFHRCPTVICVGKTNCGKSFAVTRSANYIASNAATLLEHKSLTTAAARDIFSQQCLTIIWHDPSTIDGLKTIVEETYEQKSVTNVRDRLVPHTSVIVTCNPDVITQLRNLDQMKFLVRIVPIPFNEQFQDQSAKDLRAGAGAPTCSRETVVILLRMNAQDMSDIVTGIDEIRTEVLDRLVDYGMAESASRIAFNISLNYSCTLKALSILDKTDFVDLSLLRQFVLKDVVKCSATWQTHTGVKRKYAPPVVPLSPAKKGSAALPVHPMSDRLQKTIDNLSADEVKQVMKLVARKISLEGNLDGDATSGTFLAFRKTEAASLLTTKGVNAAFLNDCRTLLDDIPGALPSWGVKIPGKKNAVRAMFIPISAISDKVLQSLEKDDGVFGAEAKEEDPDEGIEDEGDASGDTHRAHQNPDDAGPAGSSDGETPATESADRSRRSSDRLTPEVSSQASRQSRFESPKPRGLAADPLRIGVPTEKAETSSSAESAEDQTADTVINRFQASITTQKPPQAKPTVCAKCGSEFLVPGQSLTCQKCQHTYHRDCQGVQSNHFRGPSATTWRCKGCKPSKPKKKK